MVAVTSQIPLILFSDMVDLLLCQLYILSVPEGILSSINSLSVYPVAIPKIDIIFEFLQFVRVVCVFLAFWRYVAGNYLYLHPIQIFIVEVHILFEIGGDDVLVQTCGGIVLDDMT